MLDATKSNRIETELVTGNSHHAETNVKVHRRMDVLTGKAILFAPSRGDRPNQFTESCRPNEVPPDTACPFCRGAESQTPKTVWAGKVSSSATRGELDFETAQGELANSIPDWLVRVVPNKYPAVNLGETTNNHSKKNCKSDSLFQSAEAFGAHEVVIESPRHVSESKQLDLAEATLTYHAFRDRIANWYDHPQIKYISAFKNSGAAAGASLVHTHSQLIATDFLPPGVANQIERMNHHRAKTGCCLHSDLLRAELAESTRIVAKTEHLVAYCPFACSSPLMIRIVPIAHQSRFSEASNKTVEELARLVSRISCWIDQLCPGTAHNVLLHTQPPAAEGSEDSFHWNLEFVPRLTSLAGFEFSSDCVINPLLPEKAAKLYRGCSDAESPRKVVSPIR